MKRKKRERPTVCPICLIPASQCRTCRLIDERRLNSALVAQLTATEMLSLRHPEVCPICRLVSYGTCEDLGCLPCAPRRISDNTYFPEWFVWDELLPADKEYVHHADG